MVKEEGNSRKRRSKCVHYPFKSHLSFHCFLLNQFSVWFIHLLGDSLVTLNDTGICVNANKHHKARWFIWKVQMVVLLVDKCTLIHWNILQKKNFSWPTNLEGPFSLNMTRKKHSMSFMSELAESHSSLLEKKSYENRGRITE